MYTTITQYDSLIRNGSRDCRIKHLQKFPAFVILDFVAMDILGSLPRTQQENQNIAVVMDCNSKSTRVVPTSKKSSTHMENISLNHQNVPCGTSSYLLAGIRSQLVRKIFATVCGYLVVKHVTTTAYRLQTKGQAKRFNCTIATRLRHYIAVHQRV